MPRKPRRAPSSLHIRMCRALAKASPPKMRRALRVLETAITELTDEQIDRLRDAFTRELAHDQLRDLQARLKRKHLRPVAANGR